MTVTDTPRANDQPSKLGPIAGLVFGATVIVQSILAGSVGSEPTDSATDMVEAYLNPENDIEIAAIVAMLGLGVLFVFLPHERDRMRARGASWEADTLVLGFVSIAVATILDTGVDLMGWVGAEHGHEAVAQAANDFGWNITWLYTPGLLAVGLAGASAGLASRGLPRWLGIFGAVVCVGALMPWIGLFVLLVWVLALSITELIGKAELGA